MDAVLLRARGLRRAGGRSSLLLVVLIAIGGGFTLAAAGGAVRATQTLDEFLNSNRPADAYVYLCEGECRFADANLRHPERDDFDFLAGLPGVVATATEQCVLYVDRDSPDARGLVCLHHDPAGELGRIPIVVDGALPSPDDPAAITIDEEIARRQHLSVGDTISFTMLGADQFDAAGAGTVPAPTGPSGEARVAAVVRFPQDLTPVLYDQDAEIISHAEMWGTEAFHERYGRDAASFGVPVAVRLVDGAAGLPALADAVAGRYGGAAAAITGQEDSGDLPLAVVSGLRRSVSLESWALAAFAVIAGAATLVLVLQGLARQARVESDGSATLRALGMRRSELTLAGALRAVPLALLGAAAAAGVAVVLSPLTPIGVARRADMRGGVHVEALVLAAGVLVIVAITIAGASWASWRGGRRVRPASRRSRIATLLASGGARPEVVTGVRFALDARGGDRNVPIRTALTGVSTATAAVVAAGVLLASLSGLLAHPERAGNDWDAAVGNAFGSGNTELIAEQLLALDGLDAIAAFGTSGASSGDEQLSLVTYRPIRGSIGPVVLEGRAPESPSEVALGSSTMDRLGASIGSTLPLEVTEEPGTPTEEVRVRVVGRVALSSVNSTSVGPGDGVYVTHELAARGSAQSESTFFVRFADGVDRGALVADLKRLQPYNVVLPFAPTQVIDFQRLRAMPVALAALIAVLAVAALVHTLSLAINQRRHELGILAALGFRRTQRLWTVGWQSTTYAVIALAIGLPAGLIIGRWSWRLLAGGIGVAVVPEVQASTLAITAAAVLWLSFLACAWPAWRAVRLRPAEALRTE